MKNHFFFIALTDVQQTYCSCKGCSKSKTAFPVHFCLSDLRRFDQTQHGFHLRPGNTGKDRPLVPARGQHQAGRW